MALEGHSFSISNLHIITSDILLIDVILHDKEIEEGQHKCLYKTILNSWLILLIE